MKNFFITLLITISALFSVTPSYAHELKPVMEEMGKTFKSLGKALGSGKITATEVANARKLVELAEKSDTLLPDLTDFPDRAVATARYHDLMAQLIVIAKDVESAIAKNDVPGSLVALQKAADIRKIGHDEFKLD
ncbi:MAG: hypothetical protein K2P81_16100 [Bacteriovoracaceae bacterium]|nr:hypothetical protein [Bacteriovoracaceae bacterium]